MIRKLAGETLLYGIGNAVNSLIAMIVLPILTRLFTAKELGIIDLAFTVEQLGVLFGAFGIDTALTFYYWDSKGDKVKERQYVTSAFAAEFFFCVAIVVALFAAEPLIIEHYVKNDIGSLYSLVTLYVPLLVITNLFAKLCRIYRKPLLYNMLTVSTVVLYAACLAIFGFAAKAGVNSVYFAKITAYGIVLLGSGIYFRQSIFGGFSKDALIKLAVYGLPLVPFLLGNWIISSAPRYFLNLYLGAEEVGNFSIALKIGKVASLVVAAFNLAWGPFAMSIKHRSDAPRTYARVLNIYLFVSMIIVLLTYPFAPFLIGLLATEQYVPVAPLVPVLSLSVVLVGMYGVVAVGITIVKKTYLYSIGIYIAAAVAVVMNILLVPTLGLWGSALASVIAYVISNFFMYALGRRHYRIDYGKDTLVIIVASALAVFAEYGVVHLLGSHWWGLLVVAAYVAFIVLFGIIPMVEIRELFMGERDAE
jgi:O-antigen/teichoic acid export membrane protein